eukprot:6411141-Lingulodinium_polyedra.AAC.1
MGPARDMATVPNWPLVLSGANQSVTPARAWATAAGNKGLTAPPLSDRLATKWTGGPPPRA